MKAPCNVYFERKNGSKKILTANTDEELKAMIRIGWKTEDSK